MNKIIYYIGSETLKEKVSKGLQLLGWHVEDFIGWEVNNLIIYELNNIDTSSFHIPENLIIITNNINLKDTGNTHIFYHQNHELKFQFSKFLLPHLKKDIIKPENFYDNREELRILYFEHSKDLDNLTNLLSNNKKYLLIKAKYSKYLADQPIKTLIYAEQSKIDSCKNIKLPTIYKGLNFTQKKELKKINPLVPKIYINEINRLAVRKILNYFS
ncbi:MAG: hypothetical protein PHQ32_03140 [Firmicutes bacterium]|nr:hypothetical protein [Bacillota bacterium]